MAIRDFRPLLLAGLLFPACALKPEAPVEKPYRPMAGPRKPVQAMPPLESRLSKEWLASARLIRLGNTAVYYRGSAQRESDEDQPWSGTVLGDILYLSPEGAVLIPSGSLQVQEGRTVKVVGAHKMYIGSAAQSAREVAVGRP